jgi:methionyl-tRNA synthetase
VAKKLITNALPYANSVKHLGTLVGSILPADVYARFMRQSGEEILYVWGTDDHGTTSEIAAIEEGLPTDEFCDRNNKDHKKIYEAFDISWDHYGRTHTEYQTRITQDIFTALDENGLIEEREMEQIYSIDDKRFLPDRYILGTCPNCDYEKARGDQCEDCTKMLDPTDLINPRSSISGSTNVEIRKTRHLFLLQSKLADKLRVWIESNNSWSKLSKSIALKWLNEGLRDRCITRDISWGVPVNKPGFEHKVFYVWFDAPIGYISITAEWAEMNGEDWKAWWLPSNPDEIEYTQFMGKDNVPFHSIMFPGTLLGTEQNWKFVDNIKGFNYLTYYGSKFSTSQNRGVFLDEAIEILPKDYWRWYLMANIPEGSDSDFTFPLFASCLNKDLSDVLGNLVNRILTYSFKKADGVISDINYEKILHNDFFKESIDSFEALFSDYVENMNSVNFRKSTSALRSIWVEGNKFWENAQVWQIAKLEDEESQQLVNQIMAYGLSVVKFCGFISQPFLVDSSKLILNSFSNLPKAYKDFDSFSDFIKKFGVDGEFTVPGILFTKIEDVQVKEWEERFGS